MRTADHTRIIDELEAGHARMNAAGLGSPALDNLHALIVDTVSESPDPQATVRAIADLMSEHMEDGRS